MLNDLKSQRINCFHCSTAAMRSCIVMLKQKLCNIWFDTLNSFFKLFSFSLHRIEFIVCPFSKYSVWITRFESLNNVNTTFPADVWTLNLCWSFPVKSYDEILLTVSFIRVIMMYPWFIPSKQNILKNYFFTDITWNNLDKQMSTRFCIISSISILGTHLARIFRYSSSETMCWTGPLDIPNATSISDCLILHFAWTKSSNFCLRASLVSVTGRPHWLWFAIIAFLNLKLLIHNALRWKRLIWKVLFP